MQADTQASTEISSVEISSSLPRIMLTMANLLPVPAMASKLVFFAFFALSFDPCACNENDKSTEELLIKPLPSGHVYNHFQFTTVWNIDQNNPHSCKYAVYVYTAL